MSLSENLALTLLVTGQDEKELTINDALLKLERAFNRIFSVEFDSSDVTLSADDFTANGVFDLGGSPAGPFNLIIPLTVDGEASPVNRIFAVRNSTGQTITVIGETGSGTDVDTGVGKFLLCDGSNVTEILATDTGTNRNPIISDYAATAPYTSNQVVMQFIFANTFNLQDVQAYLGTVSTASITFTLTKVGTGDVGTIQFDLGTNLAGAVSITPTAFDPGDVLQIKAPSSADATGGRLSFSAQSA